MTKSYIEESKHTIGSMRTLASCIEDSAVYIEVSADVTEKYLNIETSGPNYAKTRETLLSFVESYTQKLESTSDVMWLESEFAKYPSLWETSEELQNTAIIVIERVHRFEEEKSKLAEYRERGLSRESYLRSAIESSAKAQGISDLGSYAAEIDHALDQVNKDNIDLMYRRDGGINQSWHLDGFIAEQHHAESFNLKAVAQGSSYRAEVLKPAPGQTFGKNSVDIVIRDSDGKIVKRYQSKYGVDAESTKALFEKGDYRGQRKLVPEGQAKDICNSTEVIEHEGIKSEPLSKEAAKERQRKIQEKQEAKQYEWNDINSKSIARNISQKAGAAAMLAIAFQGARVVGRRIWNGLTGQANRNVKEDVAEFVDSALKSGASAGLTVAITGGLIVVCKNGWLGAALKRTPVGQIANAICIGIENVKVLSDLAAGKISGDEALNRAGDATCSLVGSLTLGVKGATIGSHIGTALGPFGTIIGGIAGGIVGGVAGSTVGRAVWEGSKAITKTVVNKISTAASNAWDGVKGVTTSIVDFVSDLFN